MRYFYLILVGLFFTSTLRSQEKTTIKVIVPHPDDEVYIVGNQRDLGDWNPSKIKMYKVSDYLRMISIPFYFPAEFMFTKGSWATEGIIYELDNNPNIYLEEYVKEKVFKIKGWKDEMLKAKFTVNYKNEPFESNILNDDRKLKVYTPQDYSIEKRYPVIYMPDSDNMFKVATEYLNIWSENDYKYFPDCILVGVPFKPSEIKDIENNPTRNDTLKEYLFYDVVPFVNSKFSTSGFNIIAGQSYMADFNHQLILENDNPFNAIISIEPKNKIDQTYKLDHFFRNFEEGHFYYFSANSVKEYDMTNNTKMRLGSAEYTNVHLNSIEYNSFSENLFTLSFPDALKFIFKDYRNLKAYPSFEEYVYHYESDIMKAYNMPAYYQYQDINYFLKNILDKKNELSYQNLLDFLNTKDIKSGNGEQFSFSELEKAKHYFILGNYDKSLSIFEHILSKLEGPERNNRDLADTFFNNIEYALMSYGETKQEKSIFDILEKIIDILPAYILESYYLMAKYSDKYEFLEVKGESALDYCYKYYHDNPLFTKKDLSKIKF